MLDKNFLFNRPIFGPYLQPTLTDEMVRDAEEKMGFKLPKAYLDLLKVQNGGYIRFTLKDTLHDQIWGIGPHPFSITDFHDTDDRNLRFLASIKRFPFDCKGDGEYLCFEYDRKREFPSIVYTWPRERRYFKVARDFEGYLQKLKPDLSDLYVIDTGAEVVETNAVLQEVLNGIFAGTEWELKEMPLETYGYPYFSIQQGSSWVGFQTNKVPAIHFPPNHPFKQKFPDLLKKSALAYPELPESSLIVTAYFPEFRKEVFKAIKKAGFKAVSMRSALKTERG